MTWFLSPILGLVLTPVIGSASDRCTLRWGRRRPFILALCVGVLLGVALFLNGSLIGEWEVSAEITTSLSQLHPHLCVFHGVLSGLSVGDSPGSQPIGIILTVVGVVVLDFSADASEGPIRAYLLDVADTDEQDMALNIHAFSAGRTTCLYGHTHTVHTDCITAILKPYISRYIVQIPESELKKMSFTHRFQRLLVLFH